MATTTPNYGWTVPTSTDLVKDGATAIETLGDAIDASMNTALGTKKAGMVLLNTTSFSAVASQSINDVFSATYDNYKVIVTITSTGGEIRYRLRVSGSDAATNYNSLSMVGGWTGGITYPAAYNSDTYGTTFFQGIAAAGSIDTTICAPFLAQTTRFMSLTSGGEGTVLLGRNTNATSYTGFSLLPSAGTITGNVSVYGFNK
jgi:hypothetical protein